MAVTDQDIFSNVSWSSDQRATTSSSNKATITPSSNYQPTNGNAGMSSDYMQTVSSSSPTQAKRSSRGYGALDSDALGPEALQCTVSSPLTENEGGSNPFTSYLVTTNSTFSSFQKPTVSVRRRFTDFLYLYNSLCKEYPACAVPPIPEKQRMVRVTGDRFGPDFTHRRAYSLQRFLTRLSLHPVLRRSVLLHSFLESGEWNATMRSHSARLSGDGYGAGGGLGGAGGGGGNGGGGYSSGGGGGSGAGGSGGGGSSMFDAFADSFINVFTKVHRLDRRFVDVREKSDRLDEDLGHVEKVMARVVRRDADIEADLKDLAEQFQKLITLEPGVEGVVRAFAASVEDTATGLRGLREVTDQDYVSSLRDMVAYSGSLKNLLKAREQKQLDYEQLTEYLNKSTVDRDHLAMASGGYYYGGSSNSIGAGGAGGAGGGSSSSGNGSNNSRRGGGGGGEGGEGGGASGGAGGSSGSGGSGGADTGAGEGADAGGSGSTGGGGGLGSVGAAASSYVASTGGGALAGASGFLRSKLEDVRGVDHEQSRRERQRKLEMRVEELTAEVERAKKTSELFDEEVVKEVADFERIKRVEFKRQLGGLADAHIAYYDAVHRVWGEYLKEMEKEGVLAA